MISTTSSYILAAVVVIIIIIVASVYYYRSNDKQKDEFKTKCDNNRMYSMLRATNRLNNAAKGINDNMRIFNSAYKIILLNGTKDYSNNEGPLSHLTSQSPLDRLRFLLPYLNELEDFATSVNNIPLSGEGKMNHDDAVKLYNKYKKYEYNNYDHIYAGSSPLITGTLTPTGEINDLIIKTAHYITGLGEVGKPLDDIAKSLYNLGSLVIDNFAYSLSYLGCTLHKM